MKDPNGILDLEAALVDNWEMIRSDIAIKDFLLFANILNRSHIKLFRSGGNYNDINLSIDTPEDYKRLELLAVEYGESLYNWRDSANKYSELFLNA